MISGHGCRAVVGRCGNGFRREQKNNAVVTCKHHGFSKFLHQINQMTEFETRPEERRMISAAKHMGLLCSKHHVKNRLEGGATKDEDVFKVADAMETLATSMEAFEADDQLVTALVHWLIPDNGKMTAASATKDKAAAMASITGSSAVIDVDGEDPGTNGDKGGAAKEDGATEEGGAANGNNSDANRTISTSQEAVEMTLSNNQLALCGWLERFLTLLASKQHLVRESAENVLQKAIADVASLADDFSLDMEIAPITRLKKERLELKKLVATSMRRLKTAGLMAENYPEEVVAAEDLLNTTHWRIVAWGLSTLLSEPLIDNNCDGGYELRKRVDQMYKQSIEGNEEKANKFYEEYFNDKVLERTRKLSQRYTKEDADKKREEASKKKDCRTDQNSSGNKGEAAKNEGSRGEEKGSSSGKKGEAAKNEGEASHEAGAVPSGTARSKKTGAAAEPAQDDDAESKRAKAADAAEARDRPAESSKKEGTKGNDAPEEASAAEKEVPKKKRAKGRPKESAKKRAKGEAASGDDTDHKTGTKKAKR